MPTIAMIAVWWILGLIGSWIILGIFKGTGGLDNSDLVYGLFMSLLGPCNLITAILCWVVCKDWGNGKDWKITKWMNK